MLEISGTTAKYPENVQRSPGFAVSTRSFLKITSILRGMDPGGMSELFSYTLNF